MSCSVSQSCRSSSSVDTAQLLFNLCEILLEEFSFDLITHDIHDQRGWRRGGRGREEERKGEETRERRKEAGNELLLMTLPLVAVCHDNVQIT